ncbi:MAG TPA: hypothetical protein VFV58_39215 [Blastocatellia bacterium]|jgi:hypothetical protein|nr:hypothetical protein [Blastocatellia bacterium]
MRVLFFTAIAAVCIWLVFFVPTEKSGTAASSETVETRRPLVLPDDRPAPVTRRGLVGRRFKIKTVWIGPGDANDADQKLKIVVIMVGMREGGRSADKAWDNLMKMVLLGEAGYALNNHTLQVIQQVGDACRFENLATGPINRGWIPCGKLISLP